MKALKKLLILGLLCIACLGMGIFTACNDKNPNGSSSDSNSESTEEVIDYVYKIRTQSVGGFGLRNVTVSLFDGDNKIASVLTNTKGDAYFTETDVETLGEYDIVFDNIPAGWSRNSSILYQTTKEKGSSHTVNFEASLITNESVPATKLYRLGDVMYDFSIQTSTGDIFTLSEELKQKDMVLLNFWATWCSPCKSEFPAMQNAYKLRSGDVSIFALSKESSDTQDVVSTFKANQGLEFDMTGQPVGGSLTGHFDTSSIPLSVVIDRYGVISYMHTGSITSTNDFLNLFDKFIGDSYVQTVIESSSDGDIGGSDGTTERLEPNVSPPSIETITPVLTSDSSFEFAWDTEDKYAWPWIVETDKNGVKYLTASNTNIHNSYATLKAEFTASANTVLTFDAYIDTEKTDQLYVLIDDVIIHKFSGVSVNPTWNSKFAYVFEDGDESAHSLTFIYMKDSSGSGGEDKVKIKNLRFENIDVLDSSDVDLNIFQNAATGFNKPPETIEEGTTKVNKFQNYVEVALGSDGFYHVIPEEGTPVDIDAHPILFANLMSSSLWNAYSVWQVAYLGYVTYEGHNLEDIIEQYAWACSHSDNGYVPVTKELQIVLDLMVRNEADGEFYDVTYHSNAYYNPDYHKSYHDKEWLEVCVYYKHYGKTPIMGDPTEGITFDSAIPLELNKQQTIVCDQSIVPLGIKHKITVTKAGVYRFYSMVSKDLYDTDSSVDPQCWIIAEDKTTELAYCDDVFLHPSGNPNNFEIYLYLEEGTYYCLLAMFMNSTGTFDMRIDFVNDSSYHYFTNCTIGPHSFNPITNETYVPDAQYYKYDENANCYRITDAGGTFLADLYDGLDDKIYLDLINPTHLFPYNSLSDIIENANLYAEDKRLFYLEDEDGKFKDFTADMQKYLFFAYRNNGELYGKVAVDKNLMDILQLLMKKSDGFGGVENSWQLMCYYYQPIAKEVQI